ncbi:CLUMA_CG004373, isoform A [Clunio marinus]|uniref:CLUMA_CG004373, isoform A n=1 Tax=Clunio marinus TaxID=568069 RepID=A0A1J1HRH0_9DIPT|nr:CLUMA_CG004373, isoform A [Clunio marinus]
MEAITMNVLCEDVMLIIFEYLGTNDLKTSTLVCKRWNNIIGNYASTMRKFPLVLSETNFMEKEISKLNRKYYKIKLYWFDPDDEFVENIAKHLSHIQCFEMDCLTLSVNQFIKIFNSLKMCKSLMLCSVFLTNSDNKYEAIITSGSAKCVYFYTNALKTDCKFLDILKAHGISNFKCIS